MYTASGSRLKAFEPCLCVPITEDVLLGVLARRHVQSSKIEDWAREHRFVMTWVHEKIFAAGGSHIPKTWSEFSDQTGIRAVLHQSPGCPSAFYGPPPQAFLWLDLEDENQVGVPGRQLAGNFIKACLDQGQLVLLHSPLGRHRTRWAFVAFLILCGASVKAALRQAAQLPWLSPYHTDPKAWEEYADSLREEGSH
jgi:hypothetical protein